MNLSRLSIVLIAVCVCLLLLSFASYLFWNSTTRIAIALFSCLFGFFGFLAACRAYDQND